MPTSRPRISVTKDPALADALDRGRPLLGMRAPEATLVHDLAIHGARLLADEHERRHQAFGDRPIMTWLDQILESDALHAAEAHDLPIVM